MLADNIFLKIVNKQIPAKIEGRGKVSVGGGSL